MRGAQLGLSSRGQFARDGDVQRSPCGLSNFIVLTLGLAFGLLVDVRIKN